MDWEEVHIFLRLKYLYGIFVLKRKVILFSWKIYLFTGVGEECIFCWQYGMDGYGNRFYKSR